MSTNPHDPQDATASETTETAGIGRRAVLQSLLGGVGTGLAVPGLAQAQQHPVHQHLAQGTSTAHKKAASAAYTPEFLDAHQLKTLDTLSEAIVPGSTEAKVAPFLDTLLAVESQDNQRDFLGALGAFDMLAIETNGKPWIGLTAAEQDALLQKASTTAPGLHGGSRGTRYFGATAPDGGKATIGDHFGNLKQWIAGAYYSSEKGARELGWTGNVFHDSLPGCTHADGHAESK